METFGTCYSIFRQRAIDGAINERRHHQRMSYAAQHRPGQALCFQYFTYLDFLDFSFAFLVLAAFLALVVFLASAAFFALLDFLVFLPEGCTTASVI